MRSTVRQLLLASAIGAFSIASQAHGGATQSSAATASDQNAATMTPTIGKSFMQAESRYEAAQETCEQQTGQAKGDCLRDAEAERQNAISGASPSDVPAAALPNAPANVDTTQAGATSSSSSQTPGSASGTASMSSGVGTAGPGPSSNR
jgi:hypothetical protein